MSVSLLVSGNNIPESEWKSIPVATESVFEEFWLPISKELNLEYIPLFQAGFNIDSDTLTDVLRELQLMKNNIIERPINNEYKNLIERIDSLINFLPSFVQKHQIVFIG